MQITDKMVEAACCTYRRANTCYQTEAMRAALEAALGQFTIRSTDCIKDLTGVLLDVRAYLRDGSWKRTNGVDNEIHTTLERWGLK